MTNSSWERLSGFLISHHEFCKNPDFAVARLFYSRRSCDANFRGGPFTKRMLSLPVFSTPSLVCLSCGHIVVKSNSVNTIKSFWVRLRYGLAWLISIITGREQKVNVVYHYSFWSKDLLEDADEADSDQMVRVDIEAGEEKSS